jgi:hypothetical protein
MPAPAAARDRNHDLPALRPTVLAPAGLGVRPRDLGFDLAEVITALLGLNEAIVDRGAAAPR